MTEIWRPLGVDTDEGVAEYDALHDGVPEWMVDAYWRWVHDTLVEYQRAGTTTAGWMVRASAAEHLCQTLKIPLPDIRTRYTSTTQGDQQWAALIKALRDHPHPLQVADYLLAFDAKAQSDELEPILTRAKSAWTIGTRAGRPALVRRVPVGVQIAADSVMARSSQAGVRLAQAWEALYGLEPNASEAYRLAILAVEDAAVPVVSPTNASATLGTVLRQIEDQRDWRLPIDREHTNGRSGDVLVAMMRMLWHGQHDRHGGQPSAPGNVSLDEARVAVTLSVTLVDWFSGGLPRRAHFEAATGDLES